MDSKSINNELINRVLAGNATKKEAKEVVEWFSTTMEGQAYLSEMINADIHTFESEGIDENIISPILSKNILAEINKQIHQKMLRRTIMRVAAAVIPLILLAGLTFYMNSRVDLFGTSDYAEIYIPKGEKTHILFQDGSQAYLNADTKIRFPRKFGLTNRKIQLTGEAYFKISSNSKRPFIVQANNTNVKVLGTSFNVKAYKNDKNISVVLDKGHIVFNTPTNDYDLTPGQQAIFDKESGKCIVSELEKSAEASLWVNDIILFKDTPLAEVLKTLNRKYNVEFKIENPQALKYSYTLTSGKTSLEKIIRELEKISPVRFNINNDNAVTVAVK